MLYYLGKGTELKKEECKEYKTLDGALKAAKKDESLVVWDETGKVIDSLNEQTTQENEQQAQGNEQSAQENEQQAQGNEQSAQEYVQEVTGNVKATVICDGALNLRRSAAWGNDNICGRAVKGQYYYVRAIHDVDGKQMIETIDGLFLSGQKEHVAIE